MADIYKLLLAGVFSLYADSALAALGIRVGKIFTGDNIPTDGSLILAADITHSGTPGGAPFTYSPAANACDTVITGIRINPKGSMSGASGANTPTFTLQFKTQVR